MNMHTVTGHPSADDSINPNMIDHEGIGEPACGYGHRHTISRLTLLKDRKPHGGRHLCAVITKVFCIAWLSTGTAHPRTLGSDAADVSALQVGFERGLLNISAQRAPWRRVFDQITQKTGIRFHYSAPLAGSVTVSIKPLPFRQALERLLGPGTGLICRYGGATDSGTTPAFAQEVWILGGKRIARSEALSNDGSQSAKEATSFDSASGAGEGLDEAGAVDLETGSDSAAARTEIDALVELAGADDPAVRMQAVSALGDRGAADDTVRATLQAALADEDAGVRGQALQALAIQEGDEAMEHIRQALSDPDPGMRIMAVERVETKDQGIALLQEALADTDETVRSLAASRLSEAGIQGGTE